MENSLKSYLLLAKDSGDSKSRGTGFIARMIEIGLPQGVPFFNNLMSHYEINPDDIAQILSIYGAIVFPPPGVISPMLRVHRCRDFALLVDITISKVCATETIRRADIYDRCVPKSAKAIFKLNEIENDILEGNIYPRY